MNKPDFTILGDLQDVRKLFDPIQTHAVYQVPTDRIDEVKSKLKQIGAKRFRVVKAIAANIVCFKI